MSYIDDYVKTNWVNYPSTNTPINQTNLNHLEGGVKTNCGRIANLDTTKANQSDLLLTVKNVTYDSSTGTFTFTLWNNTAITINTDIEKIAVNFDYDDDPTSPHYQNLVLELSDGTYKYIDLSALITEYEFDDTSTIAFSVAADGTITANVVDGSITANKLQPNYLADCVAAQTAAETAESGSEAERLKAEGFAVGEQNGVPVSSGSPYFQNNAKYYAQQAGSTALSALTDVTISSPQDGQVLTYDSVSQKWVNADPTGGIAPQNVSDLSLTPGNAKVTIKWSDPGDTVISGVTICKWAGTKLVMKTGSYPTDVNDGTLVVDNTVLDQYKTSGYEVTGLTNGTTYYFQLFPYSDQSAVNKDSANRVSGTPEANVTITLTLNGAKEDTIVVKDSNNQTIGTCIFASGQTSETITASVPVGYSDTWSFTSSVAKDTTTGTSDYVKTATVTDAASQTVNVYHDGAFYWYGNLIDASFFYQSGSSYVQGTDANITANTNSFTVSTSTHGLRFGVLSTTAKNIPASTFKARFSAENMASQNVITGQAETTNTAPSFDNQAVLSAGANKSLGIYSGSLNAANNVYPIFIAYSGANNNNMIVTCYACWLE